MWRVDGDKTTGDERRERAPDRTTNDADNPAATPGSTTPAHIPIRLKLVAVLFLPAVLLAGLTVDRVLRAQEEASAARAEAQLAQVATGPGSLLNLLINERNETAVYLLGAEEMFPVVQPGQYLDTRIEVDSARDEFEDFIANQDAEIQEMYEPALLALRGGIEDMRRAVDADAGPRDFQNVEAMQDMFEGVEEITQPLFDANRQVPPLITDPHLTRATTIIDQSMRQSNSLAILTYQLAVASIAGDAAGLETAEQYVATSMQLRDMERGREVLELNARGTDLEHIVRDVYESESISGFFDVVRDALDTGAPELARVFDAAQGDEDDMNFARLREVAEGNVEQAVQQMKNDADATRYQAAIVSLIILAIMGAVTTLVVRSITRPLRALAQLASSMAKERLPQAVQSIRDTRPGAGVTRPEVEPIQIETRDEVADVAYALNTVQDSALNLAMEQVALRANIADSFVNLGRRNQTLLSRQLDFISDLERDETDADRLDNLFQLDHLATRMRRNAESLLVLASVDPPRRWTAPIRLTDAIRASLSEVESYQRATIEDVQPATLIGPVAPDLAHLLAELIENALAFSPPDQPVEIRGQYTAPSGAIDSTDPLQSDLTVYTVTVTDHGVGMTEAALTEANLRLKGQESWAVTPSRFLGHHVTGRIAARYGIAVTLRSSPTGGIMATVQLPPNVLAREPRRTEESQRT